MDDEYCSRFNKWPMMIQKEAGSSSSCLKYWGHNDVGDSSANTSWEEQAFAEDIGGVWPPRSYSCSFCRREFRSAQALGGHMNVHRRDRAKLKQQLHQNIHSTTSSNNNQILQSSTKLQNNPNNIHHHHHYEMMCSSNYTSSSASFDLDLFSLSRRPSSSMILPAAFTCTSLSRTNTTTRDEVQHQSSNSILFSSCSKQFEPPSTKRSSAFDHILQDSAGNQAVGGCSATITKKVVESMNYNSTTDHDDSSKKKKEEEVQVEMVHFSTTTGNKLISSSSSSSNSSLVRKSRPSFHDDGGLIIFKKRQRLILDADDEYYLFPKNTSNLRQVINKNKLGDEEVVPAERSSPNSTLESNLDLELRLGT